MASRGGGQLPQLQVSQVEVSQVQLVPAAGGGEAPPPPALHAESMASTNSMETPVNPRLLVMIVSSL
jgi:hypothetical protein